MCTLCLSDMGELRDEWLREPPKTPDAAAEMRTPAAPAAVARATAPFHADLEAVAA